MTTQPVDDQKPPLDLRIARDVQVLASQFSGIFSYETVYRYVHES